MRPRSNEQVAHPDANDEGSAAAGCTLDGRRAWRDRRTMKQGVVARWGTGISLALLGGFFTPAGGAYAPEARADEPRAQTVSSGATCVIKGNYPLPKATALYDAASGGRTIATFTGAYAPLELSEIPTDAANGRSRLRTTSGSGSFRIEGYVATSAVPVFTARDISVSGGYVWISSGQKVKLVQGGTTTLTAERTLLGTSSQTARGSGPCDAFALQPSSPTAMEIPGNGRGYLTKSGSLDLFDAPNGNAVFTLRMNEGAQQLFWSTEARAGYVHIKSRADVTIDAWAKQKELEPLKKGEMMDQLIPSYTKVEAAQLAIDKPPRLVQATREIAVRFRRDEKEKPIGAIEPGAEVYVMETMAGWVNVLPKSLSLMPGDEGGFWIPVADVPKL